MIKAIKRAINSVDRHTLYFMILIFLLLYHIPIVYVGGDSIGLYDFYLVVYTFFILLKKYRKYHSGRVTLPKMWQEYFMIVAVYICYLLLRYRLMESSASILIVIKQIENMVLLFNIVVFLEIKRNDTRYFITFFMILFFILSFVQVFYVMLGHLGIISSGPLMNTYGHFFRLGLPLMKGISPNPAGFVFGSIVIFYTEVGFKIARKRYLVAVAVAVSLLALLLTVSKTNIIALIIAFIVRLVLSKRKVRTFLVTLSSFVLFMFILTNVAVHGITATLVKGFIEMLLDPKLIFTGHTFTTRYEGSWPIAFNAWLENGFTFFFGKGVNFLEIVDGTIPRLLSNQGLVGTVLFHYIWFVFYKVQFNGNRAVDLLLVFALVNGINGETLLMSYRATGPFIAVMAASIYGWRYLAPDNKQAVTSLQNTCIKTTCTDGAEQPI